MVALDFEESILDRAACAEPRLQLLEELLPFLLQHLEALDDRDGLPAPGFPVKPDSHLLLRRTHVCLESLFSGLLLPGDSLFRGVD